MAKYRHDLPQRRGGIFLTDGGMETTLIFHEGIELPHFAAFVLLDSPVSGGPQGAIDGTLTCMVGGADAGFSAARAVFDAVGKTITLLGPAGSGQGCKSANQLIIVTAMQAAATGNRKAQPERLAIACGSPGLA